MILLPKEKSSTVSLHQTRPISLLHCLGKVYERCFLVYLIQWMKMNGVLPSEQSGFRKKHSTATRFMQFPQHISSGLLQQTATLVIYVDFIKAFDQLRYDGLIYKMHKINCPYELVIFIVEYLKNRKSYIEMNRLVLSISDVERESLKDPVLERFSFHSFTVNCLFVVVSTGVRIANATSRLESIEASSILCHWMEATDQLRKNRVVVDTSTSVSPISRSRRWWKSNKENFSLQIPGQLCRWTILFQSTLQQNASENTKQCSFP